MKEKLVYVVCYNGDTAVYIDKDKAVADMIQIIHDTWPDTGRLDTEKEQLISDCLQLQELFYDGDSFFYMMSIGILYC